MTGAMAQDGTGSSSGAASVPAARTAQVSGRVARAREIDIGRRFRVSIMPSGPATCRKGTFDLHY